MAERRRQALATALLFALVACVLRAASAVRPQRAQLLAHTVAFHNTTRTPGAGRPAARCHFDDPFATKCLADEKNVTITGVGGAICSSPCSVTRACPQDDFCPGHSPAAPALCALQDAQGKEYCALVCSTVLPILDPASADAACGSDERMACAELVPFGLGVCVYTE